MEKKPRMVRRMPPKPSITKEEIVEAALSIVEEEGMASVTARNVALRMGLSTQPIYMNFSSMQALRKEVMRRAREMILDYSSRSYTDRVFLNMGAGLVFFARDHKTLYRLLFMKSDEYKDVVDGFVSASHKIMKKDKRFMDMTQSERDNMYSKMWHFTHGFASLISVGLIRNDSDKFIIDTIDEMGTIVITAALKETKRKKRFMSTSE